MSAIVMRMRNVLSVALIAAVGNGCTFCFLQGNGPRSRDAVGKDLPSVTLEQIEEWKKEAHRPIPIWGTKLSRKGFWREAGYTVHYRPTLKWSRLVGPYYKTSFYEPDGTSSGTKRSLIEREDQWGVLEGLYLKASAKCYDCETGECIWAGRFTFLATPLVQLVSATEPSKGSLIYDAGKTSANLQYRQMNAFCVGFGVIAAGSMNGRAYFQIAWIPIRLWSLE